MVKNVINAVLTGLGAGFIYYVLLLQLVPKPLECPKIEVQQGRDVQSPEFQREYQARELETHF